MKISDAIIEGYRQVDGRQCFGKFGEDAAGGEIDVSEFKKIKPHACCVIGAYCLGAKTLDFFSAISALKKSIDDECGLTKLNDGGMDWQDIVGILQAEGK